MSEENNQKSKLAEREEEILKFWRENKIFEKTLKKPAPKGEFVFYEGPPTTNGHPGIHHLEARAFKDVIPRYKTMRGFHVGRKGGFDTHGLPVEIQVEKELGLKSKKEIENYGIAAFNTKCKDSVWKFVHEWEVFTDRSGYWVDLKDPYITYKTDYIEALWGIVKKIDRQKLLYKDYKVVPWCPRCCTALSSHELAQGYEDVKDLSVTVKFKVKNPEKIGLTGEIYLLAWTTTPWTLSGNVGLAVGKKIIYIQAAVAGEKGTFILAKERAEVVLKGVRTDLRNWDGEELVGLEYEPLYPFLRDSISGAEKEKLPNAFKVYSADFVTTTDGTGIVHTAVMYGQDDFELGSKIGLPKFHLVNEDGTFKKEAGFLAGKFVKGIETDVAIIRDLDSRDLLFAKEKFEHSYPFCWRCHTPLIYFARDSWYIKMSALRDKLVKENEKINWEPSYIKEGRFGEWLREVKDWAISRERYWGTPLPVWICDKCGKREVVGSVAEIKSHLKSRNKYFVVRHGESENNVIGLLSTKPENPDHLTDKGKDQIRAAAKILKKEKIDLVYVSPFIRTRESAEIIREAFGLKEEQVLVDARLSEISAHDFNGKPVSEFQAAFSSLGERFSKRVGGENYSEIKNRVGEFLYEIDAKNFGKNILVVSHEAPIWLLTCAAGALSRELAINSYPSNFTKSDFLKNAEVKNFDFVPLPHDENFELDLHRPAVDGIVFSCDCGGAMRRVKEVMDVWFDSGSMPFASGKDLPYPADFISEAIDQTRGWFYTLHAVGILMGKGAAYKNVICLGHVLDAEGKKMSKSVGNIVDPFLMMEKYGADTLRFWMYSVNQPGEPKNFDEKTVDEVVKKVFNLVSNILAFYQLYTLENSVSPELNSKRLTLNASSNILDKWIVARLNELTVEVTKGLDSYKLLEPTRAIRDFIADFSQWYLRRSRGRFKNDENTEDKTAALLTTRHVLLELSKLMAPFTPFFAEHLYKSVGGEKESVHLEEWPDVTSYLPRRQAGKLQATRDLLSEMAEVRRIVSLALEARAKANIKIRQPLQTLQVTCLAGRQASYKLRGRVELLALVKDEVNVKEIVFDSNLSTEVSLDLTITPALLEEGQVRELIRAIQELRKNSGLTIKDRAVLLVETDRVGERLIEKNQSEIIKAALLKAIEFGPVSGEEVAIDSFRFRLAVGK